jgi:sulfur carrier protein
VTDNSAKMQVLLNGERLDVARGVTVSSLLGSLEIAKVGCAVAIGFEVVPRSEWELRQLQEGDEVEIVTATAGG